MRKLLALLLALALICSACTALADGFTLEKIRQYPNVFTIDERSDDGICFVDAVSQIGFKDVSFEHKYESNYVYSVIYTDVIVLDYGTTNAYPVWRLWIEYTGTQPISCDSFTLVFGGHSYTFTGVSDPDRVVTTDEGEYAENLLVKFSTSELDFLVALENYCKSLSGDGSINISAMVANGDVTLILHGASEDLTVKVNNNFLVDYMCMDGFMLDCGGNALEWLSMANGNATLTID